MTMALAVLAGLLLVVVHPPKASARLPRSFVGVLSYDLNPYAVVTAAETAQLRAMKRAGIGTIRRSFEVTAPPSASDAFVLAAAQNKIRVVPMLLDNTRYNAASGPGHGLRPPPDLRRFAAQAGALADRYGPHGTFWKGKPRRLRRYAIRTWQVWNEPNLPVFWLPKPKPRRYAKMVKLAGRAIHRQEKRALVVTAGIPDSKQSKPRNYKSYLRAFLRAGGWRQADAIGVHAYSPTVPGVKRILRTYRRVINPHHGRKLKLLITELGWADKGHRNPMVVGRKGQARRITKAYRLIAHLRHRYKIAGVFYFQWRDYNIIPGDPRGNTWGYHTGLHKVNGKPKPAWRAFKRVVRRAKG
jgi:hypothetical protein